MTDPETNPAAASQPATPPAQVRAQPGKPAKATRGRPAAKAAVPRPPRINPTLEKLAEFYPHLFGAVFLPLKRGIFQDLLAAHPDVIEREALKEALAQHTRSTRYLTAVAAGQPRHDLQGQVVEAMAPEHVYLALLEVFRRRHARTGEDVRPKLRERIVQAFQASGLPRGDYDALVRGRDEEANVLLDEALAEAQARAAKDEALLRAFEASGKPVEVFAEMYGMDARAAARMLERARRMRGTTPG
ncbi:MAG TPA: ProQ/FINO family protein [Burkholderiales bacterium]|nr:ProQ/FINO family protein [Burkholderiales bacterium]